MKFIELSNGEMLNTNAIQLHKVSEQEVEKEFHEPYGGNFSKVHRRRVRETILVITKNDGETVKLYGEQADKARSIIEGP
jgi:hypothetical protein